MHRLGERDEVDTYTVEYGDATRHGPLTRVWDAVSYGILRAMFAFDKVTDHPEQKNITVETDGQTARALRRTGYPAYIAE